MISLSPSGLKFGRRRPRFAGRRFGLTTIEAVGMTIIIGIMAGLAYPAIYGLRQSGMDQQAIGVAQTLNQAQQTYLLRVSSAEQAWEAAPDQNSKYLLVAGYVPFAADSLTDFTPSGYTITLGTTLSTKVAVAGSTGTAVSY